MMYKLLLVLVNYSFVTIVSYEKSDSVIYDFKKNEKFTHDTKLFMKNVFIFKSSYGYKN